MSQLIVFDQFPNALILEWFKGNNGNNVFLSYLRVDGVI